MRLRRVLFAAPLPPACTCESRLSGLRRIGLEVEALDMQHWAGRGSRLAAALSRRVYLTPPVVRMNAALLAAAARHRPDVLWLEKGVWIYPPVLWRLRAHARFVVNYHTDDLFSGANYFWMARAGLGQTSLQLTTNRFNIREIPARSPAAKVFRVGMGYDDEIHRPPARPDTSLSRSVVFIGHYERHTEGYVVALRDAGIDVRVWGHMWDKAEDPALRRVQPLPQEDYAPTIAGAAMALCSLSQLNRNESTGRTFEIPAIGGCLLAERLPEHAYLYRDGQEAVLFDGTAELVRKARHYLEHRDERDAVAEAGRARLLDCGLSWQDHMAREWPLLERLLLDGEQPRRGVDDQPFWPGYRAGEAFDGHRSEERPVAEARAAIGE